VLLLLLPLPLRCHCCCCCCQVSLFEVMPSMCVSDLVKILDDYARNS
jgi:hypothetical protein